MRKYRKYIQVNQLIKKFNFEVLYKGNLRNRISIPSLNRTGIELASNTRIFKSIISAVL
jgi:serine kinase of HPr protein (carbohydrate metabolism regulator)